MMDGFAQVLNPYAQRGVIRDPTMFFGRKRELEEIFKRLRQMQSVSVVGERRIGKSSLLFHVCQIGRDRLGDDFIFVYIDVQGIVNAEEFYERAVEELGGEGDTHRDLERALSGRKVLFCLDEFEKTTGNDKFDIDFFNVLRSLAQTGQMALVVATQRSLLDLTMAEEIKTSPFFNIFAPLSLGELAGEEAEDLATTPAERVGMPFDADEIQFAIRSAGRHPWKLQVLCYHLFEAKRAGSVNFDEVRARYEQEINLQSLPAPVREGKGVARPGPSPQPLFLNRASGGLITLAAIVGFLSMLIATPVGFFLSAGLVFIALLLYGYGLFQRRES